MMSPVDQLVQMFNASWSVVVFYRNATDTTHVLALFDGLDLLTNGGTPSSATINQFLAPNSGQFDDFLGIVAYCGDHDQTGDTLLFNNRTMGGRPTTPRTTSSTRPRRGATRCSPTRRICRSSPATPAACRASTST
jgi:hypothetical protein